MSGITRRGFVKGAALAPLAFTPLSGMAQQSARPDRFDIVVAGAGHNSLVTAAYLSKAGFRCVVLEGRPTVGGGVKSAQLTIRGFIHDTCSSAHGGITENPLLRDKEIDLAPYGLEYIYPDPVFHMPFLDGSYITQWKDPERTRESFARINKKDGDTYWRMFKESENMQPTAKFWQRRLAMSHWDIIRMNFEDVHSRCFMLACPWSQQPPQFPMTGRVAYSPFNQQRNGRPLPKGGSGKLGEALAKYIQAHDGVILTGKPVAQLIIENGKCTGVECADGSKFYAEKGVLSTIHIKHLVDMAPKELWGKDFVDGVETWQPEFQMMSTNYATTVPLTYPTADGPLSPVHSELLANPERALRFAFDYYSGVPNLEEPPVHLIQTSVADPTRAPSGMHTVKVVGYHPYDLKEGPHHWDNIKEHVADETLKYIQRFSPTLTHDKILEREVMSPLDLERMNPHNWHGSCHAGGSGPAQAGQNRPMPGWANYKMPIPGLYQTGGTTAPGGSVSGQPGRNAAIVMLKDLGTSIEQVVAKKETSKS
ncbi:MAG TPA: NAD(P)/FAD-dependent oxidoreductase [Candidatus Acidoferrales bacterium]|jgi:phytoene dehydrogenase-like protein|nr:NAD(P)/FAD-dependent oxidoreductase [Candidatus Acidoferrales bacterium]